MSATPSTIIDNSNVTHYNLLMIKSFADKHTEQLFLEGVSKSIPLEIMARTLRKLDRIDTAYVIGDLSVPPENRLHMLEGNRKGQYSISINDQWRICFRFEGGNAFDVQVCDYH